MPKRFLVASATEDGGVELHPMKEWLRQHPQEIPVGLDATMSTSHQLRLGLKKKGWTDQDTGTEMRMIPPGAAGAAQINAVLDPAGDTGDTGEDNEAESAGEAASDASFGLEYQLRDFIAQNIETIAVNGRHLRLYVDPTGKDGVEYPTAVGPIDILAVDVTSNALVAFELKRGRTPDYVMGQLTRYMGWLKSTIGKDVEVHGVIVAKQIAQNLRYAVRAVPNVSLFEYEVSFTLKTAHDL